MSVIALRPRRRLSTTDDLCAALGIAFSDEQLTAITAPLEPGVIIAGAGSGKTTVMAARVVWLVGTGQVRPDEVLGLTFTRKAAAELAARVRNSLERAGVLDESAEDGEEVIMTYDSFAARLVAEHGLKVGAETDPVMITGAARFRLAGRVVSRAPGPFAALSRLRPLTVTERVLKLDSDLQAHLVDADAVRRQSASFLAELERAPLNNRRNVYASVQQAKALVAERLELLELAGDYAALKRRLGVVEFADQLALAARLVREVGSVARQVRRQFRVVLLDEYQDTSSAQATLLQGLFSGADPDSGRGHAVTAVGDPFQAIYGWRGAAASNIVSFARDYPRADGSPAHAFSLTVNRRSLPAILDVANELGTGLRAQHDTFGASTAALRAAPGKEGGVVAAASFESWDDEVAWLAESIVAVHATQAEPLWSDTAVLTRRNADIGAVYAALVERDVPVEIVGLGGLLSLPEIEAITAMLAVVNDVGANAELVSLLTSPRWRIGPDDLAQLGRRAVELNRVDLPESTPESLAGELAALLDHVDATEVPSLALALDDPGQGPYSAEARERFAAFASELRQLRAQAELPVDELVAKVVATLGLEAELAAGRGGDDPLAQVAQFSQAVLDYTDVDGDSSLAGLLAWFDAELRHGVGLEQATPTEQNSVKLLTIHKAKGLEWEHVFLPGLNEGTFPSDRVTDNWTRAAAALPAPLRGDAASIAQVREASHEGLAAYGDELKAEQALSEDRLAYVAVTRAKQVLVGSRHTWRPGAVRPRSSSRYFNVLAAAAEQAGTLLAVAGEVGTANPLRNTTGVAAWPRPLDETSLEARREAAGWVSAARDRMAAGRPLEQPPLTAEDADLVARWDDDLELLRVQDERRRGERRVALPRSVSASQLVRFAADPASLAADLVRPMPRPPSTGADLGTRFHDWVQRRFGLQPLFDDVDRPQSHTDLALARLQRRFEAGPLADRVPVGVEVAFLLRLGGHVVRGRIDAVYTADDALHDYLVLDWKTSNTPADPTQLAIYRLAWAEAKGVDPARVAAGFYYVLAGELDIIDGLPDRAALTAVIESGATLPP